MLDIYQHMLAFHNFWMLITSLTLKKAGDNYYAKRQEGTDRLECTQGR